MDDADTEAYELDTGSDDARSTTETEMEEDPQQPLPQDWRVSGSKFMKLYHGRGFFFMSHDLGPVKQKELFSDMATRKCMG